MESGIQRGEGNAPVWKSEIWTAALYAAIKSKIPRARFTCLCCAAAGVHQAGGEYCVCVIMYGFQELIFFSNDVKASTLSIIRTISTRTIAYCLRMGKAAGSPSVDRPCIGSGQSVFRHAIGATTAGSLPTLPRHFSAKASAELTRSAMGRLKWPLWPTRI